MKLTDITHFSITLISGIMAFICIGVALRESSRATLEWVYYTRAMEQYEALARTMHGRVNEAYVCRMRSSLKKD